MSLNQGRKGVSISSEIEIASEKIQKTLDRGRKGVSISSEGGH